MISTLPLTPLSSLNTVSIFAQTHPPKHSQSIADHMLGSPKHYSSYTGGNPGLPPTTTEQTNRGVTGDSGTQQQVTDLDTKQDF